MSSLSEIIFRLLAWLRPVLWYYHRLHRLVALMLLALQDEETLLWLNDTPDARADLETAVADGEHCLDIAIALRARELLGWPIRPEDRPGIGHGARIHCAPSLERLAARMLRLAQRFEDIERLARLHASRLRRMIAAAPVQLIADHRPHDTHPGCRSVLSSSFLFAPVVFLRGCSPVPAGLRVRAPP